MAVRIDNYPTHKYGNFELRQGKPVPFGASLIKGGVNFSVYSINATACELVLFNRGENTPFAVIPFLDEFRIGNVFAMIVYDLDKYENLEYGFRMNGPYKPSQGHIYDHSKILMDPYAKAVGGRDVWGEHPDPKNPYQHRARIALYDYDWEGDKPLEIRIEDLIIYEMHVRGFTCHPSSGAKFPGTFSAIREKIPYLKELGINCIELMPVFEFDEFENSRISDQTGEYLKNYWGYSPVNFVTPKSGYAASGRYKMAPDEFKTLIKDLHKNGIEVILDVVFNHTAEGNEHGEYISFKGIDNKIYYMMTPDGYYYNFSGCGNTLNCNNPVVRNFILDSLRYWVSEYHIDGLRFDLASVLGRNEDGTPMNNPPLIETLALDPVLGRCKLIAEAWDAGGLYQVGVFSSWGRWAEWNGKYRDDLRKFLKGDEGLAGSVMQRIQGSQDIYRTGGLGICSSINFITCHDGFTLMDLVSYNQKHNEANQENNRDGSDQNYSWNCGVEGPTNEPRVNDLRRNQIRNAISMLMISQGIPMIYSGDEMGNSQLGNNNAYCQDNEISWLNWDDLNTNRDIFEFFKRMIEFRKAHPVLRYNTHDTRTTRFDSLNSRFSEITWHGVECYKPDTSYYSHTIAAVIHGKKHKLNDDYIYFAANMHWESHTFELPKLDNKMKWYIFVNTDNSADCNIYEVEREKLLENQGNITVAARSIVILVAKV